MSLSLQRLSIEIARNNALTAARGSSEAPLGISDSPNTVVAELQATSPLSPTSLTSLTGSTK